MKLELSIAFKYLIPRKKKLSSAIISLFSIGVISLVTWLSIVFISVMHGLEQRWIHDLSQLHSPIKISPSSAYYDSYYYQIDKHSDLSQYTTKTLGEKLLAFPTDPYDARIDYSLPEGFPLPDKDQQGDVRDLVKIAFDFLTPYLHKNNAQLIECEEGVGLLRMERALESKNSHKLDPRGFSQFLAYASDDIYQNYLLPYEDLDYCSGILNSFNTSSKGWREDFSNLQQQYRGASILLPIHYRDMGYRVGDRGSLNTTSPETGKEIQHPVYVIGFYNPGLSPMGSRIVFIDMELASVIRSESYGTATHNGLHVFFPDTKKIKPIKSHIQNILDQANLSEYWEVSSLFDNQHFKPILDQLQSDQTLFLLVSFIILIVACSNVITMAILLVNNKKKEIGILKAMGASSSTIKMIFSLCGAISGAIGILFGTVFAIFTLKNLATITQWLSLLQGREAFHATFFGRNLPQDLHIPTLIIFGVSTFLLAAIAGIIPAIQVARMSVSDILKSE